MNRGSSIMRDYAPIVKIKNEEKTNSFVLSPYSKFNLLRLTVNTVYFYLWKFFIYYRIAFGVYNELFKQRGNTIDTALDIYFLLFCILSTFFVGTTVTNQSNIQMLESDKNYVDDMKIIFVQYFKTTLVTDIISMVPFFFELFYSHDEMSMRFVWVYYLKLFRFLRANTTQSSLQNVNSALMDTLNSRLSTVMWQLSEFFFMILELCLTIHMEACLWLLLGRVQNGQVADVLGVGHHGWIYDLIEEDNYDVNEGLFNYVNALSFITETAAKVGYSNDVKHLSKFEMLFLITIILINFFNLAVIMEKIF